MRFGLVSAALFAFAPAALLAPPAAADESLPHRLVGPVAELAHHARDAWDAAERTRLGDEGQRRLLALAGAARLACDRITEHDVDAAAAGSLLDRVAALRDEAELAARRGRASREVLGAIERTSEALASARAAISPPTDERPTNRLEPPAEDEATDPDAPTVTITQQRWAGTFTPDLALSGTLEGIGLRRGEILLLGPDGTELARFEDELNQAIQQATAGARAGQRSSVPWSLRIDDDAFRQGDHVVLVRVWDARARTGEARITVTPRMF